MGVPTQIRTVILQYGTTITLRTRTPGSYSGGAATVTNTDNSMKIIFDQYRQNEIDGARVRIGDRKGILAAESIAAVPKTGDHIVDSSETWSIVEVTRDDFKGEGVVYTCQLRK